MKMSADLKAIKAFIKLIDQAPEQHQRAAVRYLADVYLSRTASRLSKDTANPPVSSPVGDQREP